MNTDINPESVAELHAIVDALDAEMTLIEDTIESHDSPREAILWLINWHVTVALNPDINGGFVLKPKGQLEAWQKTVDEQRKYITHLESMVGNIPNLKAQLHHYRSLYKTSQAKHELVKKQLEQNS